ncbi:MAG: hypothetical protein ACYTGG_07725 [Planctomycetota bacterium]|jgi:hypothetical protein
MRVELRDDNRHKVGRIDVDPAARPTRVVVPGADREVFLTWDGALDDAGQLRTCIACGCRDLFQEKAFPQITGLVVVIAFAGAVLGVLGLVNTAMLAAMVGVLLLDIGILILARRRLVCYRCRTSYHDIPIARYHQGWDRPVSDRHPAPPRAARVGARRPWWRPRGAGRARTPAASRGKSASPAR